MKVQTPFWMKRLTNILLFCSYQHFLTMLLWNSTFLLFSSSSKVFCLKIKTGIYTYSLSPSALPIHLDMCISSIHSAHRIRPLFTSHLQIVLSLILRSHSFHCIHTDTCDWIYYLLHTLLFKLYCKLRQFVYTAISLSYAAHWPLYFNKLLI